MAGSSNETIGAGKLIWTEAPSETEAPAPHPEAVPDLPSPGEEEVARWEESPLDTSGALSRFREYVTTRDPHLRAQLIQEHHPLAQSIARRFTWPGMTAEDILQIARIGLIHAVDRFDPCRGVRFVTFATHTIAGEVKRYLRDCGWPVKIPRHLRELHQQVRRADDMLTRRLQRPPTIPELASYLQLEEEIVMETQTLGRAATPLSMETPVACEEVDGYARLGDHLGSSDGSLIDVETRLSVHAGVEALEKPQREIVRLRYFDGLTQSEVAQRLSLSQMHISRLERRALAQLRLLLADL